MRFSFNEEFNRVNFGVVNRIGFSNGVNQFMTVNERSKVKMPVSIEKVYGHWRVIRIMSKLNIVRVGSYKIGKNGNKVEKEEKNKRIGCRWMLSIQTF